MEEDYLTTIKHPAMVFCVLKKEQSYRKFAF